jgi:hypothetical protein
MYLEQANLVSNHVTFRGNVTYGDDEILPSKQNIHERHLVDVLLSIRLEKKLIRAGKRWLAAVYKIG